MNKRWVVIALLAGLSLLASAAHADSYYYYSTQYSGHHVHGPDCGHVYYRSHHYGHDHYGHHGHYKRHHGYYHHGHSHRYHRYHGGRVRAYGHSPRVHGYISLGF